MNPIFRQIFVANMRLNKIEKSERIGVSVQKNFRHIYICLKFMLKTKKIKKIAKGFCTSAEYIEQELTSNKESNMGKSTIGYEWFNNEAFAEQTQIHAMLEQKKLKVKEGRRGGERCIPSRITWDKGFLAPGLRFKGVPKGVSYEEKV